MRIFVTGGAGFIGSAQGMSLPNDSPVESHPRH